MKVTFDTAGRNGVITAVTCINFIPESPEDEEILACMPNPMEKIPFWISKGGNWLGLNFEHIESNVLTACQPAVAF